MGAQPDTGTSAPEVWHGVQQILAQVPVAAHLATYLEDSHISLRLQTQRVSLVDRLEAFHAAVEGDGSRRLSVAVPVSQAGNHPGCPGEAEGGVRVFLLGGVALQRR